MKLLLSNFQREAGSRVGHAIFFGLLFLILGYFIPKFYYQYLDTKQYITVDIVTYNKKVYKPCESVTTRTQYYSDISAPVTFHYRVYWVHNDKTTIVPKSERTIQTFINQTDRNGVVITGVSKVPCDYKPGVYYAEGVLEYEVKEHKRSSPYRGALVTVEEQPTEQ